MPKRPGEGGGGTMPKRPGENTVVSWWELTASVCWFTFQVQPNMTTVPLDNLNHGEYTASQIRLHRQQLHGADVSSRRTEYTASTASYYSSNNSLTAASEMQQDCYSSSQAPDDHYDSSDYRVSRI